MRLQSSGGSSPDYTNASYLPGYSNAFSEYIASQGPLGDPTGRFNTRTNTEGDFWRMIWYK